ncbi:unnamed protein product [Lactuca virosa]|uniref:Uncharacterized protein n=1 Tax=Lactuca virosa TaxID=75947 RepID=A0AAU9PJD3_9ASTR|nr:unnamed protein product [Lactuca virosa]
MDVLAKKWVRILQYREVDLEDRVFPSFSFCNDAFITRDTTIQDVEQRGAVIQPSRSSFIDHVGLEVGVESSRDKGVEDKFVEDTKEGVLPRLKQENEAKEMVGGGGSLEDMVEDDVDLEVVVDEDFDAFVSLGYVSVLEQGKLDVVRLKWLM